MPKLNRKYSTAVSDHNQMMKLLAEVNRFLDIMLPDFVAFQIVNPYVMHKTLDRILASKKGEHIPLDDSGEWLVVLEMPGETLRCLRRKVCRVIDEICPDLAIPSEFNREGIEVDLLLGHIIETNKTTIEGVKTSTTVPITDICNTPSNHDVVVVRD